MKKTTPKDTTRYLKQWVKILGWRSPVCAYQLLIGDDAPQNLQGLTLRWYECGAALGKRIDCYLQINEYPIGQAKQYAAAVFAIRYRLCTGWHQFQLFRDPKGIEREANRLKPWLDGTWFDTIQGRRQFRETHPECAGYSRARLNRDGPPYEPHQPKPRTKRVQ